MGPWPADYAGTFTLAGTAERHGVGLHSGQEGRVRLQPAERPGYWLGWLDQPDLPLVRLHPGRVQDTTLCTALQLGQRRLATVEHLLAALAGTGITQAEILVEGHEIPLLDGSALPWVEAIAEAGCQPLELPSAMPELREPLTVSRGPGFVTAIPAAGLRLGAAIEFTDPAIGRQLFSLELTPAAFVEAIAPARTFGLRSQVDQLRAAGLIQGGALDNALVCDGDRWLNPPLRFADEPVRHKILDLMGDLALVGLPRAHVFAYRGSHGLHTALAAALADLPRSPFSA
ncbi:MULTISPECIES: UDP-3-O-acyl-N-acetylglucosamine deacetylase [Aphanothece]|uniref:UDP-3-O-acyl-N-acetylglucosamine deacetylase n=1 Tax=Aphanothece TaxID=1121 RepID=UPI0039847E08